MYAHAVLQTVREELNELPACPTSQQATQSRIDMRTATETTLIHNGQLVDGTGSAPIDDGVLVIEGGKIAYVGPQESAPHVSETALRIDACGGTVMPGLVEAHFHATYFNIASLEDLDIKYPVEYVSLLASVNSRLALESGYTAARSGGSLFNVDFWLN